MNGLSFIPEPRLRFGFDQELDDPRDGLSLFGPLDKGKPFGIRWGVVGTARGMELIHGWVLSIQGSLLTNEVTGEANFRPPFPGFESAFGIPFAKSAMIQSQVDSAALARALQITDNHERVHAVVDIYADRIKSARIELDDTPDLWFVVVSEEVYKLCRPESRVAPTSETMPSKISSRLGRRFAAAPSMFEELNADSEPFKYEANFHNQLKARLLELQIPTQVVRETTLAPEAFLNKFGYPMRKVDASSTIAWNLSTAAFYKASGRPWKLAKIRDGVCYLGLVFKRDNRSGDASNACCAAQMFLDSGDGLVFRGAVGPWYSHIDRQFHLTYSAAKELVELALRAYRKERGHPPAEMFVHGRISIGDEEWAGFTDAGGTGTKITGVKIRKTQGLKLYTAGKYPVLRGLSYAQTPSESFLWTVGFIPRLQTYLGKDLPNPQLVSITRGDADIKTVLTDILSLTKLNYNACLFGDGDPVTLRFADSIGEILTAGPIPKVPPLPFKYYL